MRFLKITVLIFISAMAMLFLYANTRVVSPAEKLEHVSLVTFSLNRDLPKETVERVGESVKQLSGVTACNANCGIASVVFHPNETTEKTLTREISAIVKSKVTVKIIEPASGGCPVHGVTIAFSKFISTLDLRKHI